MKEYSNKQEIYEDYPALENLNIMMLAAMRLELKKFNEDKLILNAVDQLFNLLQKEIYYEPNKKKRRVLQE